MLGQCTYRGPTTDGRECVQIGHRQWAPLRAASGACGDLTDRLDDLIDLTADDLIELPARDPDVGPISRQVDVYDHRRRRRQFLLGRGAPRTQHR